VGAGAGADVGMERTCSSLFLLVPSILTIAAVGVGRACSLLLLLTPGTLAIAAVLLLLLGEGRALHSLLLPVLASLACIVVAAVLF
jgi:hypothetical protein